MNTLETKNYYKEMIIRRLNEQLDSQKREISNATRNIQEYNENIKILTALKGKEKDLERKLALYIDIQNRNIWVEEQKARKTKARYIIDELNKMKDQTIIDINSM